MTSFVRLTGHFRRSHHLVQCRKFTSTTVRQNDVASNLGAAQVQKKPIGGFRGGYIIITIILPMLYVNIF